jgi:hypothetical protein
MVVASGLTMYVLLHGWLGAGHGDGAAMPRGVYGKPEPGKALAVVHTAGKTINFSGVECRRLGSGVDVSYGKSIDDTTYFHAVVIFGPPNEQSQYVLAYVPLLIGHRPGVRFDLRSKVGAHRALLGAREGGARHNGDLGRNPEHYSH